MAILERTVEMILMRYMGNGSGSVAVGRENDNPIDCGHEWQMTYV